MYNKEITGITLQLLMFNPLLTQVMKTKMGTSCNMVNTLADKLETIQRRQQIGIS
jgi:hypothetical protein